ncbi:hypothetical protein [Sphaerisporangium sp. TRM90804]|uniref:hypothetical protein n=1 Tax=Sphaerisporangium sp. TRM90804 TaxID=3031113 RepID=UPI00244709B5|nr:hypothetical protein [Sphaerisporangium sp. TRM90804]MDH2426366.1 hypothetical protein [Sphaerisporangium sp. TRM90804]
MTDRTSYVDEAGSRSHAAVPAGAMTARETAFAGPPIAVTMPPSRMIRLTPEPDPHSRPSSSPSPFDDGPQLRRASPA